MIAVWLIFAMNQIQNNNLEAQSQNILKGSLEAGQAYSELFREGKELDAYNRLGFLYQDISKPIHAKYFFGEALKIDPNNQEAKEGVSVSEERIAYLESRIQTFNEEIAKTQNHQKYCAKAAVLFHLGKAADALNVLDGYLQSDASNREVLGLRNTFLQGLEAKRQAHLFLEQQFQQAIAGKQLDQALTNLGQMVFYLSGQGSDPILCRPAGRGLYRSS